MDGLLINVSAALLLLLATSVRSNDSMEQWIADAQAATTDRPNVLYLVIDDLRPWIGAYGTDFVRTPNIDALAAKSVRFDRAYCQEAICGPSRTSFMTGRRPDTTRVHNLNDYWRDVSGDYSTVTQYFKDQGYHAQGMGKIFHQGDSSGGAFDYPESWSVTFENPDATLSIRDTTSWYAANETVNRRGVKKQLEDTELADLAVSTLEALSPNVATTPFFLAVGFYKPHLPFRYPEAFDDIYHNGTVTMELAADDTRPADVTSFALTDWGELRTGYSDIVDLNIGEPDYVMPDDKQMELRIAYAAAVNFIDDQVGRILQTLEDEGLAGNTIVTLFSDHGFQLGENGLFCKNNNYETSLRVPLLVHVPGVTDQMDSPSTDRPVELVDLFPTLTELAGLPDPGTCPEDQDLDTCVEGTSLVPLLRQATGLDAVTEWKDAAFSQSPQDMNAIPKMGYSIRTADYRYTEWVLYNTTTYEPRWNNVRGIELYVHNDGTGVDPDPFEHSDKSLDSAYTDTIIALAAMLRAGWRDAVANPTLA